MMVCCSMGMSACSSCKLHLTQRGRHHEDPLRFVKYLCSAARSIRPLTHGYSNHSTVFIVNMVGYVLYYCQIVLGSCRVSEGSQSRLLRRGPGYAAGLSSFSSPPSSLRVLGLG